MELCTYENAKPKGGQLQSHFIIVIRIIVDSDVVGDIDSDVYCDVVGNVDGDVDVIGDIDGDVVGEVVGDVVGDIDDVPMLMFMRLSLPNSVFFSSLSTY